MCIIQGEKALWSPWTGIVDWALVCKHFADEFQKMGGKIYLNYEVTGFSEMAESKEKAELSPILVQSKNRVCIDTTNKVHKFFIFNFSLSYYHIVVYADKICVNVWWFAFGSSRSNDRMRS